MVQVLGCSSCACAFMVFIVLEFAVAMMLVDVDVVI